jgi:ferredoxin-NADP reductase
VFNSDKKIDFKPGQYLEWTLGHNNPDSRGNRRYFTISSSPTEENIMLGIKTYEKPSTFKTKLMSLEKGDTVFASQLAGEFTMPKELNKKMVWIAGGIGVTPFRSMAKYMIDKKENRDTVLFFSNRTSKDIVYSDVFSEASTFGLRTINVVNSLLPNESNLDYKVGFIDEALIRSEVPDFKERSFYISGPHGMVSAFESTLKKMGVPSSSIKIDFFPGFA